MIVMSTEKTLGFCKLEWEMLDCEAFQHLSDKAARALMVLMRQHNGRNNGEIVAATRWMAERMGCCQRKAANAIRELVALGFVRVTREGSFDAKNLPAVYALTCYPCGDVPATKDYLSVPAASPAEAKRGRTATTAIEHQDAHEKHFPEHQDAHAEHWDAHDRAPGCSPPAYRAPGCSIPEHQDAQSIDLPSPEPTPSAAPVVAVAPPAVAALPPPGAVPTGEPTPAGAESRSHLAGCFTSPAAVPPTGPLAVAVPEPCLPGLPPARFDPFALTDHPLPVAPPAAPAVANRPRPADYEPEEWEAISGKPAAPLYVGAAPARELTDAEADALARAANEAWRARRTGDAGPAPVADHPGCPAGIDPETYRVMRASAKQAPIVRGGWDRERRAAALTRATNDGCGRHSLGARPTSPHRAPAAA